jgi:hypothetical protein
MLRRARGSALDEQPHGGLRRQVTPAIAGSVVTVLAGATLGWLTGLWAKVTDPPPPSPLAVIAEKIVSCPSWVIDKDPEEVPSPPLDDLRIDAWETSQAATPARAMRVDLVVQGTGAQSVVLQGLDVDVMAAQPRSPGALYRPAGCGGAVARRYFGVDLERAEVRATAMNRGEEIDFPFTVSSREVESFVVFATATRCDCQWRLRLRWSSGTRSGVEVIDDGGKPFHTIGPGGRDVYEYDERRDEWVRSDP